MELKCIVSNVDWFIKDKIYKSYESGESSYVTCEEGIKWWLSENKSHLQGIDDALFEFVH